MIRVLEPRRITAEDYHPISRLIFHEVNAHRHLDWRSPLEWIGAPNYWALEEYGRLTAVLACPEDPPQTAWIRLFAYEPHLSPQELWSVIWETARQEISPPVQVASIVTKQWFKRLLLESGFQPKSSVVMLELNMNHPAPPFIPGQDFSIRPMRDADMPDIARIDKEAFGDFWRNTADALHRARSFSIHATIAENASGILGYQISTGTSSNAHLARLAVHPQWQGHGIGSALLREMLYRTGGMRYTVNTQQDNAASLALYKKFGFIRTGESFPVLVYSIS